MSLKVFPDATPASAAPSHAPIHFRDGSLLGLGYRVNLQTAAEILGDSPLEPIPVLKKALALLCIFQHRDSSLGTFNEVAISIHVRRKHSPAGLLSVVRQRHIAGDTGLYVAAMPVNTPEALAANSNIWGFPKYLTGVETSFSPGTVAAAVQGEFTLTHAAGFGFSAPGMAFVPYTIHNGRLLRTLVQVDHRVHFGGASTVDIQLHGDGPAARLIRLLRLHQLKPSMAFRTCNFNAIVPAPEPVG